MRPLLVRYASSVQLASICASHQPSRASSRGQITNGRCRIVSQRSAFSGMPGAAHGAEYPGDTCPALAKLVARPAPGCRSMTVTSCPARARK